MKLVSIAAQYMTFIEKNEFQLKKVKIWLFLENFWLIIAIFREIHRVWRKNSRATVLISLDAQYTTFIEKKCFQVKKIESLAVLGEFLADFSHF